MQNENTRLIRMKDVCEMTGLSQSSINRYEERGDFPRRRKMSTGWSCWIEHEVQSWIQQKLNDAA